jgi:hypothetical protein
MSKLREVEVSDLASVDSFYRRADNIASLTGK